MSLSRGGSSGIRNSSLLRDGRCWFVRRAQTDPSLSRVMVSDEGVMDVRIGC